MIAQTDNNPNHTAPAGADNGARRRSTSAKRPPMVRAELLGRHAHETSNSVGVNIWQRGNSYLARGYYARARFGETLGKDQKSAEDRLVELLYEIGQGTYVAPSDRGDRQLGIPHVGRLTARQLCDEFLLEKRQTCGEQTTNDYCSRLIPLIEFSERDQSLRRWKTAADIDRVFAIEFRNFVAMRMVTRNGRSSSQEKVISPHQVYNVLDCTRTVFNWGKDVQVAKLPASFVNPFTADIVGQRPQKDPLRRQSFPLLRRIQLVQNMDEWQLTHLALSIVLPLRPEDCAALLIEDVDFEMHLLTFGTRFGGRDFNKGRVSFRVPFPTSMVPVLRFCSGGRACGPLLRARRIFEGRRKPLRELAAGCDVNLHIEDAFRRASPRDLKTPQDQKQLVRRIFREIGGVSERELTREFSSVLANVGLSKIGRFYDLRGSVNTEMDRAGVTHLVQRYVTGHTTADILNVYVSLDPVVEMQKYFATVQPLLEAMLHRAYQLGLKLPI